jgi:hypothetical protein
MVLVFWVLYDSPVISVIEDTGFHPSLFRCAGIGVTLTGTDLL